MRKKYKATSWASASRRAKLKFKLRMQRGKIFKRRWAEEREFMLKCQARLIAKNRESWERKKKVTKAIVDRLPEKVHMAEFRPLLLENIKLFASPEDRHLINGKTVQKFVVRIRQYGLMTFDSSTLMWTVAYPRGNDTVGS